ncbi:hypothetical protein C0J52_26955 [Blattella germanica]|nr:hypothetical protein C0J52_26955 [Blattella germanica]
MKCLVIVSCVLALAAAKPGYYAGPYAGPYATPYAATYAAPYAAHVAVAPAAVGVATSTSSQYHAQDTLGQYSYGYSGGPSAKTETRTADGITRGGYSYIDGNGLVQSASYVSDPVNGFRVAATNLPVGPAAPAVAHAAPVAVAHAVPAVAAGVPLDTPEVAAAKAAHFAAHAQALSHVYRKKRSVAVHHAVAPAAVSYAAAPAAVSYAAPAVSYAAPAVSYAAPAVSYAAPAVSYAAPAVSYAAPAAVAVVEPVKSFGYSTATAHADNVVVAAPAAPVAVAHAAPAVSYAAPVAAPVYVEPVKSFGYSTATAHADPVVVAARAAPVAVAAPAAVSYAAPAVAPVAVAHAAPVAVAGAVSSSSQYQAQDTLGQYSYGYADRNSQKHESRSANGITQGGYSYVDGHGIVQSANYVADALGFRVAATNLPVGPAAP